MEYAVYTHIVDIYNQININESIIFDSMTSCLNYLDSFYNWDTINKATSTEVVKSFEDSNAMGKCVMSKVYTYSG